MIQPHERKRLWENKGIQVTNDDYWRCPHCSTILAKGKYPDLPVEVKCRRCGNYVTFQRL